MKKSNIVLIGMPGAGKSTVGVVLAKKLGKQFVDTDLLIQAANGACLSSIIANRGNDALLAEENRILAGLDCENHVIATGGSAVYGKEAMAHLTQIGCIVFLDASYEKICNCLGLDAENICMESLEGRGVVLPDGMSLEEMYNQRLPLYRRYAQVTIKTDGFEVRETVELAALKVAEYERSKACGEARDED